MVYLSLLAMPERGVFILKRGGRYPFLRMARNPIEDSCFSMRLSVISNYLIRYPSQNGTPDGLSKSSFFSSMEKGKRPATREKSVCG